MKDILTAPFLTEMRKTAANMYRLGWDERNGGNISYLLEESEVAQYLDLAASNPHPSPWALTHRRWQAAS